MKHGACSGDCCHVAAPVCWCHGTSLPLTCSSVTPVTICIVFFLLFYLSDTCLCQMANREGREQQSRSPVGAQHPRRPQAWSSLVKMCRGCGWMQEEGFQCLSTRGRWGLGRTSLGPKPLAHSRSLVMLQGLFSVVSPASEQN